MRKFGFGLILEYLNKYHLSCMIRTIVPHSNILQKLCFHVCYEIAYKYKKFQNINIKILTTIMWPKLKTWY